jgi:WD40 repeat protein
LPISKLSEADQRHVKTLAAANPFGDNPASAKQASDTKPPSVPPFVSLPVTEIRAVDISKTRSAGNMVPEVWGGEPDPVPPYERLENVGRVACRVPVGATQLGGFFVHPNGNVVVAYHVGSPVVAARNMTAENNFTRILLGTVDSGTTTAYESPLKLQPYGYSPDGKRVLIHQDDWTFPPTGKRTLLHIVEQTLTGWTAVTFEPFAQLKRPPTNRSIPSSMSAEAQARLQEIANRDGSADIHWATWVDNEHIFVQSDSSGTLILMNVNTGEAIWRMKVEPRGDIALSPGGKYCFVSIDNRAILCETMTGKVVGSVDNARSQKFRFSPDGKRFATCTGQGIILGDMATGAVETAFFVPNSASGSSCIWLDNRYLWLQDGNVVDTVNKTAVWSYTGLQKDIKFVNGYWWGCPSGHFRVDAFLIPLTLPHAKMTAKEIPADGNAEFVLKQGAEVSVVFDSSIDKNREEIQKSIEKRIADNGWVLVDGAPVSLVLKVEEEKADKVGYTTARGPLPPIPRPIMSPLNQGGTTVEFKPERYHLSIMLGKKEIWSKSHLTTPPQRIKLDEIKDDSLQEVVDKAMEAQSYYEWLDKLFIPRTMARPWEGKGTSRITENGIEEVQVR